MVITFAPIFDPSVCWSESWQHCCRRCAVIEIQIRKERRNADSAGRHHGTARIGRSLRLHRCAFRYVAVAEWNGHEHRCGSNRPPASSTARESAWQNTGKNIPGTLSCRYRRGHGDAGDQGSLNQPLNQADLLRASGYQHRTGVRSGGEVCGYRTHCSSHPGKHRNLRCT